MLEMLASLFRPSAEDQSPEIALIRGLAHVVAGAALALVFGPVLAVLLYLGKEAYDLWGHDGDPVDGAFDVAFVSIGACAPPFWPFMGIGLGLVHAHWISKNSP